MAILHIHIQRFYGRKTHPFLFLFCCSLKTTFPSLVNCNHNKRNTARIITLPKSSCYFKTFGHEKIHLLFMIGTWIFAPKRSGISWFLSLETLNFSLKKPFSVFSLWNELEFEHLQLQYCSMFLALFENFTMITTLRVGKIR